MYFFFFQAEDGIRDGRVTGVQTCALPISTGATRTMGWNDLIGMRLDQYDILDELGRGGSSRVYHAYDTAAKRDVAIKVIRSEERRVGKECRSRWWPDHKKKKEEENSDRLM